MSKEKSAKEIVDELIEKYKKVGYNWIQAVRRAERDFLDMSPMEDEDCVMAHIHPAVMEMLSELREKGAKLSFLFVLNKMRSIKEEFPELADEIGDWRFFEVGPKELLGLDDEILEALMVIVEIPGKGRCLDDFLGLNRHHLHKEGLNRHHIETLLSKCAKSKRGKIIIIMEPHSDNWYKINNKMIEKIIERGGRQLSKEEIEKEIE
jgi:hypothetical protein